MNKGSRRLASLILAGCALALLACPRPSQAYIEVPYALGRVVAEATNIVVLRVEKVDTERNLIIYRKVQDLKGKHPTELVKHNIGKAGFHPREAQFIMQLAQVGKIAVKFHNSAASETCLENYWYQTYPGGEWWNMVHGEPYLLRTFAGKPEKLITIVQAMLAGQDVVVPCMVDGDKNALQLRSAKMQRMKASLKLLDYNPQRDFAGWGNDELRRITNMPGFSHLGAIGRVDPGAIGIAAADFTGDGQPDLCLWGEQKVLLVVNAGNSFEETSLPYTGGARAAAWGDYNGDAKPDLLLATPAGLKLFTNEGGKFRDDSATLPVESYYNLTAVAWIDADADGKLDILAANGFLGLRLYRNKGTPAQPAAKTPLFEDSSDKAGLGLSGVGSTVKGDHLAVADVNGDGRMDFLYSAGVGLLALNTPQGFVEAKNSGLTYKCGKVAPVFGDFNGDKLVDLFVPQTGASKLYKNDGKGNFVDVTAQSGDLAKLAGQATSAAFADFGKQGKMDLLIGCLRGPSRFFRNKGDGTFTDAGEELGLYQKIFNTRALCIADLNKDGVLDLVLTNEGQDSAVLLGAGQQSKTN